MYLTIFTALKEDLEGEREWSSQGRFMPPGLFISRLNVFTKVAWPLFGVNYATKRLGVWRSYGG